MSSINDTLRTLLYDTVEPNHLAEVAKLKKYIDNDCPFGEPIFLSLGETWEDTPVDLCELLGKTPPYSHGYQLSMYGLPKFRQVAAKYIKDTHGLSQVASLGDDYEVAITWTGTRNAMYDFGRLLLDEYFDDSNKPKIITTAPGWDYPGVFNSLGFEVNFVYLEKKNSFHPSVDSFQKVISSGAKSLLVINAQHNPTSANWPEDVVRQLIVMALKNSLAILIDDAHYGVTHTGIKPTSSLTILQEELKKHPHYRSPWMAFRSLGKQFSINGWGVGLLTSKPEILDRFVNSYRAQHIYNYGGMLQYALAEWLETDEPRMFLATRSEEIQKNKMTIKKTFIKDFGFQESDIFIGDCTNFVLFSVPKYYAAHKDGVKKFLDECINYGIILTDAWPKPYDASYDMPNFNCVRLFAGASDKTINKFISRLKQHKFHYDMRQFQ